MNTKQKPSPEPAVPTYISTDEAAGQPNFTVADQLEWMVSNWDFAVLQYDAKHWRKNGEETSPQRYAVIGAHPFGGVSGPIAVNFYVDCFVPSTAMDAVTKKSVEVRRHLVKTSRTGEPIFPQFMIHAVDFVKLYSPDPGWMAASEWLRVRAEIKELIDLETKAIADEDARNRILDADRQQQVLAQQSPVRVLVEALNKLGVKPQGGAA